VKKPKLMVPGLDSMSQRPPERCADRCRRIHRAMRRGFLPAVDLLPTARAAGGLPARGHVTGAVRCALLR
jgi:hypothetical protein